ncbi:hypothetical protein LCGC14_2721270 [marine sediment metagenome]|uniref:Uncharacterized protein n=1 Tax=marine sediment metagenome TaxID=412755 RepID=A0A0F9BJ49_9ZZZZ
MEVATIFIQVEDRLVREVSDLLGGLAQAKYHFVILPLNAKLLSRDDLLKLIKEAT